jgi:hypothetical protein
MTATTIISVSSNVFWTDRARLADQLLESHLSCILL